MILDILLWFFLAYRNSERAKRKGQKPFVWGFYTVIAIIGMMMIGSLVVVLNLSKNIDIELLSAADLKTREAVTLQLMEAFKNNPLNIVTIYLFSFGGYLLIRYLLDKKPEKKEPEIHWMDKMGQQ